MTSILDRVVASLARTPPMHASDPAWREAAVAVLLAPDPDQLLVIRRSEREGDPWSGHLALPGGRREPSDPDLLRTAIRETEEETGIRVDPGTWRVTLDDLTPRHQVLPPIMVRPFVFHLPAAIPPGLSSEVAHAGWVPMARFARPDGYRTLAVESRGGTLHTPGYHLEEGFLWGMTERILTPIINEWKRLSSDES